MMRPRCRDIPLHLWKFLQHLLAVTQVFVVHPLALVSRLSCEPCRCFYNPYKLVGLIECHTFLCNVSAVKILRWCAIYGRSLSIFAEGPPILNVPCHHRVFGRTRMDVLLAVARQKVDDGISIIVYSGLLAQDGAGSDSICR